VTFDVAARAADAHGAVENTQTLVSACAMVGYRHPDLTSHGAQIIEWFACDEELDLAVLGADCDRLQAALMIAEDAMRLEDAAAEGLNAAWEGAAGSGAADFVARHRRTVGGLVELVRSAVGGCISLRDTLWHIVDTKVAAAIAIDERRAGERSAWLTAARTVMSGVQDRSAAVEIVEKAVVPYVDSDIRIDWVDAMRSARASAVGAYSEALRQLSRSAAIDFAIPSHLLPSPAGREVAVDSPPVGAVAQQSWTPISEREPAIPPLPEKGFAAVAAPEPLPASPAATPPQTMEAPIAAAPAGGLPSGSAALPNLDGFTSGLSDPLPRSFDGLSETDPFDPGADGGDRPGDDSADESDDQLKKPEHDGEDAEAEDPDSDADDTVADSEANDEDDGGTGRVDAGDSGTGSESSAPQVNSPLPAEEHVLPPARELAADSSGELEDVATPCEIAADELPQVGE